MCENLYWYRAELIRCVDGDSAWFFVDRGFKDFSKLSVRLARIDCPEMRGAPEEVEKGIAATEFAQQMYDRSTNCSSDRGPTLYCQGCSSQRVGESRRG